MAYPTYRFGAFVLDPARHELRRGDEELSLPLKVFSCIVHLIENRDRAVGRDELIHAVWGDVHLTDSTLGQAIRQARQALGDSGDDQQVIQTVRGFGYRWAAPVELEAVAAPPDATRTVGHGKIAVLLPVVVEPDANGEHAWVRLGVMDLVAQHLRAAGQPMVRSDTVIALMQGASPRPRPDEVDQLAAATGAQLVLSARAQVSGTRWRVSLHSLLGAAPPVNALGEAHDVMEAARIAADRMALSLGLTPTSEPDAEPQLAMLLRKTEAAMLAQQMDAARELIESADPGLRAQPEIRLQLGWIEYHGHRLDTAQTVFDALLADPAVEADAVLRARVLHGLGGVHFRRGDHRTAQSILEEAMSLHGEEDPRGTRGRIQRLLGFVTLIGGDFDAARVHLARARKAFEATGDVRGLAALDNNLGVLAILRDRFAEAVFHFESATSRQAALYDVDAELRNHANAVEAHLGLLDPPAALALEPRLQELLAQTVNPRTVAHANLTRAALLDADGQCQAAERLLTEALHAIETHDLRFLRTSGLLLLARRLARDEDWAAAARVAADVVEPMPPDHEARLDEGLARAWLILVRGHLARGDRTAAAAASAAMTNWAQGAHTRSPRLYAALAEGELAAAAGRDEAAETAFERALALADGGYVPLRLLHVAESYVPWLLADAPHGIRNPERALVVADRVAPYADRQYGAALVQLRAYHALGPQSAWRAALARTRSLSGERQIPADLLVASSKARK